MNFTRIESVILYTCSVLFSILIFYIFYRVILIAWKRLLLKIRPQSSEPPDSRQDRRIRELLQRPSLRNLLASRAEFVQERQRRQNAAEIRRIAADGVVSQTPSGRVTKEDTNENNNLSISLENTVPGLSEYSTTDKIAPPPPYDSISMYSGPPPSYHSDDNT